MKLLDNDELQKLVDYSFGDQSGVLGGVPQAFTKKANIMNEEFRELAINWKDNKMSLFIDNIRLYLRPLEFSDWMHMKPISDLDKGWLRQFDDEDLLNLCAQFPHIHFTIFTAFEDTPLDNYIWERIPKNVIIHAANAVVFGGRVIPFPHGLERYMYFGYNHQEILARNIDVEVEPTKLLFVCHREDTGNRANIKGLFRNLDWTIVADGLDYEPYIDSMKDCKFVLCPSGNGIESARNWETLYMKRVPVFEYHPYLEEVFRGLPVLFVDKFENVTEELLNKHTYLFDQAKEMNMDLLDLDKQFASRI